MDMEFIKSRLKSNDLLHWNEDGWDYLTDHLINDSESLHCDNETLKIIIDYITLYVRVSNDAFKTIRKSYGRTNKKDDLENRSLRRYMVALEESVELSKAIADCINDLITSGEISDDNRLSYIEEQADVRTITMVLNKLMNVSDEELERMRDIKAERISNSITDGDTFF